MAGLPWFEMDVGFHDSPKVKALSARLREPLADAYVARIYAYCYRHAKERFDPHDAAVTLEDAAVWRGRRGALVDTLFAVGILERDGAKVVVHGVADRLGPHIAKRLADAKRQRDRRTKVATSIGRHADRPRDVARDDLRESRGDKDKDRDLEAFGHDASVQLPTVLPFVVGGEKP